MAARITSRSNPLVRRVRQLGAEPAARKEERAFIAEGVRLVEEALAARSTIEEILHSPRLALTERGRKLLGRLRTDGLRLVETTDSVLDSISDAETSQGILAIVHSPPAISLSGSGALSGSQAEARQSATVPVFWVVGWGLQDPGNVGALLRTADAAGADLFLTLAGTADPTSPKAVRASAGSIFRMQIAGGLAADEILEAAASRGVRLFGTDPSSGVPYSEADYAGPIGFVFGCEGEGLPQAVAGRLHGIVTIPMREGVESLNVVAAAAVVLFEAARRRRGPG